jgi:hypothetical protein
MPARGTLERRRAEKGFKSYLGPEAMRRQGEDKDTGVDLRHVTLRPAIAGLRR